MRILILALATFGGIGYFPLASGTAASLAAMLPYWLLRDSGGGYFGFCLALAGIGVWTGGRAEGYLQTRDPHPVVIDEVLGFMIAAAGLPRHWLYPLSAFFLFRLFDVWKPQPIDSLQKLPGGWGIMADDVLAGIYANLLLHLSLLVWRPHP